MSPDSPVITGVGLVTPLGRSADATWRALLDRQHVTTHTRVACVGGSRLPRVASIALEAASEAVSQAGWTLNAATGVVGCTSKGQVEDWIAEPAPTSDHEGGGRVAADLRRSGYGMGFMAAAVAAELGLGDGPRLTLSAACAGGLQAVVRAALLIRSGEADRVLIVAGEASVHPMFVASFDRLGVLPPRGELCRPYDVDRNGFLMSEAAAAICLERPAAALSPLLKLGRFATAADASHLTGIDRDGRILRRLVTSLGGPPFDLVHGHGTATELNDAAELSALAAGLPNGGAGTALYSHKAALGHTLGASGLVSAVLNVLCHRWQTVPPNVNTRRPMPTRLQVSGQADERPIRRSLACAAGFGGGVTAVAFETA